MSATIIPAGDCCAPCSDVEITQVPGPKGDKGDNGTNGTNGLNSTGLTAAAFPMPAIGADTASILVDDSTFLVPGQYVFVQTAGTMTVTSKADSTHAVFRNLGYSTNAAAGTNIPIASRFSPAGQIGVTGTPGTNATPSPTTTKGDLIVDNGANNPNPSDVRLAVGANGTRVMADNGQATGMRYAKVDLNDGAQVVGPLAIAGGGTGQTTRAAAFAALTPPGGALGAIISHDGGDWITLPGGSVDQVLTTNAAGIAVWTYRGRVIYQIENVMAGTFNTNVVIPFDDTVPLNTEGSLLVSQAITPRDPVNSSLAVEVMLNVCAGAIDTIIAALFNGATCVAATSAQQFVANKPCQIYLIYTLSAAAGAAATFNLRIGTAGGANLHVNGIDDGAGGVTRKFGGVQLSYLRITEFSVP